MALLKWDQVGEKTYETGCDHGVLYVLDKGTYPKGVAWNGLTSVSESPSGAESNKQYADNMAYLDLTSNEEFGATIECFTYPKEFRECDGTAEVATGVVIGQQKRKTFGFCYRTKKGNDVLNEEYGYKLHLIYGAKASPSEKGYTTMNESPEAITFSYEITTTPVPVTVKDGDGNSYKPTACITIDSTLADPDKLKALEDVLFGTDPDPGVDGSTGTEPRLPLPDEVFTMFAA